MIYSLGLNSSIEKIVQKLWRNVREFSDAKFVQSCGGVSGDFRNIFHLIIPAVTPRPGFILGFIAGSSLEESEEKATECNT